MTIQDVKQIKLADYLQSLGYTPVKQQGRNLWYKSPLREETDASFKVNTELEKWYDFGIGKGGNILALAAELYRSIIQIGRCSLSVETHRGADSIHPPCIVLFWQTAFRQSYLSGIKGWRIVLPCSYSLSARKGNKHRTCQKRMQGASVYECRQTLFCHRLSEHGRRI